MSGLSRFCRRARSLLARRSDVGGRVACQKRVDWSRPATGIPSDAITQRDNRRNGPRRRAVARYWLSLSRDSRLPSGLNPHLRSRHRSGLCPPTVGGAWIEDRALEDREDPGGRGSFRRSAACEGLWYQHGFSTGCWRVAAVRTRAEKAPLAYSAQVHARYICALTCQYSSCRRDVALRRHDRVRALGRATRGPDAPARFSRTAIVGPTRRRHGADRP